MAAVIDGVIEAELAVDREALRAHVARLEIEPGHGVDVVLAFAAATGSRRAVERIIQEHGEMIAHAIRAVRRDATFVDEVAQELRARMFAGTADTPPRLLRYGGKGSLGGWLRVAATRLAIDLARSERADVPLEDVLLAEAAPAVPDRDREVVRESLRAAIAAQPSRTRALLRFYYCDGMGVEEARDRAGCARIDDLALARVDARVYRQRDAASARGAARDERGLESSRSRP